MSISDPDLSGHIRQLQQLYDQGLLSEANFRAALDGHGLGHRYIERQINVAGNFVSQSVSPALPRPIHDGTAQDRYLRHLIATNHQLPLQGIRAANVPLSVALEDIYVELAVKPQFERIEVSNRAEQRLPIAEALRAHQRLVVLGEPGCGKTTLLRYLALSFAREQAGENGLLKARFQLEESRLPIMLALRDVAGYLHEHQRNPGTDGPKHLLDFVTAYFNNQNIPLPDEFLENRLSTGACLWLFDGLDEIADFNLRQRMTRLIDGFTQAFPNCRFVVTCRKAGYGGPIWLGAGYQPVKILDLSPADIAAFVSKWNLAVEAELAGKPSLVAQRRAEAQTQALLTAISTRPHVAALTANPLLLTVIAVMGHHRAQLPERRAELYEEVLAILLNDWDEAKGLPATVTVPGSELNLNDRRDLLAALALQMMNDNSREIEQPELQQILHDQFNDMLGSSQAARKATDAFLPLICERSGLLVARGDGIYVFSHYTFQEYLAARVIADRPDFVEYTVQRTHQNWWHETIRLEASWLSTQGRKRALRLVQAILDYPDSPELPYSNLILAADCLYDIGIPSMVADLTDEIIRRLKRDMLNPDRTGAAEAALARLQPQLI